MAQGKSLLDDIKKELECPVCQEQFSESNEPKILKCQHTFCKSCLNGWLRQHGGGRLSCPNCRVITECPNHNIECLPTNLACKNLGDLLKAHSGWDIKSLRENLCERHRKNIEYYCEQCQICICSDCVIVEHRDSNNHKIVSAEDGAKMQAEIVTEKLRSVEANTSHLRSDIVTLLERREKFNTGINQATKEVRNAAEMYINLIHRLETSVTEQLARERSLNDDVISQELLKLNEKLEKMTSAATRGRAILENHNIDEMINIKQVLDELISEKVTPLLKYPDLKYTPYALPRNFTLGKLYISRTEPSLSVATGEGLTKGKQSEEANFTVTTKDATGQTTYSKIDNVIVEVTSVRNGIENISVVVKDLKDGRYSVSYTPNSFGEFRVSIKVRDEPIRQSPFKLFIHNNPKHEDFVGASKFQVRRINHSSHVLSGASQQVSLFVEEDESAVDFGENGGEYEDYDEEDVITIIASGIVSSISEDVLIFYFENSRRSGGGDVSEIHFNEEGEAVITFAEVKDLKRLLEEPHEIDGQMITVVRQPPSKKVPLDPLRVHVQGISETTTKDCLSFYLEKFALVDVEEVYFGVKNNALAVFDGEPDFESLLHNVNKDKKGLRGEKPRLERVPVCSCILVTGLKKESTDITIDLYFENVKRSGGRDVCRVERIREDQAVVHFEDHTTVQDVIARSQRHAHVIDGAILEVTPYYPFL
ncbi:tripartite motif-containing protein 2-like isoform X2 [Stylophora pistillata]|uniref:Tripartite motif-containing protein 3 n=1 Tax=Stylophora pistillata TaxID=50429 RepID=A0A2B4S3R2_STYPI|nr:tripartite motif-containing protein 2-like isoform X2 [Stylophora pistillata]PFX25344.1 Tripartite motif-containing protein 3 [Stylophora pistillata]